MNVGRLRQGIAQAEGKGTGCGSIFRTARTATPLIGIDERAVWPQEPLPAEAPSNRNPARRCVRAGNR